MNNPNFKRIAAGIMVSALLLPSITFAQTTPMTPAYRASLEQLLTLLEQELASILSAQPTTVTTTPVVASVSSATSTISVAFTNVPAGSNQVYSYVNGSVVYQHNIEMQMAVTTTGSNPIYIPLTAGSGNGDGVVFYTSPASLDASVVSSNFSCGSNAQAVTSGANQYCMLQPNTTGDIDITFTYNEAQSSPIQYQIGVSSVNYTSSPANVDLSQYIPTTSVMTPVTPSL